MTDHYRPPLAQESASGDAFLALCDAVDKVIDRGPEPTA